MACDGNISHQEIDVIKGLPLFQGVDVEEWLPANVDLIKTDGYGFLRKYLQEVKEAKLTTEEACELVKVAVQTIEADKEIEYNEIAFFKKIRSRLDVSDNILLAAISKCSHVPDLISPEDYLLPDITEADNLSLWENGFIIMTEFEERPA